MCKSCSWPSSVALGRAAVSALPSASTALNCHNSSAGLTPRENLWQAREGLASPQAETHPETGLVLPGSENTGGQPWRETENAGGDLCGPSNEAQQQKEGLGVCRRDQFGHRTKHRGSRWGSHIKDVKSIPSAYTKRAGFLQSPMKRTTQPCSLTDSLMILSNMTSGGTWKSKTKY